MDGLGRRLAVATALALVLLAMALHYGAVDARHDQADAGHRALAEYDRHVGETVYFWGRVADADADGTSITVAASGRTLAVTVNRWARPDRGVRPGDAVQVYGRLEPGGAVDAERVVVSPAAGLRYLYAVSAVGLLLALASFLRSWRFDTGRLAFVPREDEDA